MMMKALFSVLFMSGALAGVARPVTVQVMVDQTM